MIEMKVTEPPRVVGIAWYRAQDYSQIREIMTDAANFPPTFVEWREKTEQFESDLKRQGHTVLRAIIDPEIFPVWCKARGLNIDATARAEFANEVADRHFGGNRPAERNQAVLVQQAMHTLIAAIEAARASKDYAAFDPNSRQQLDEIADDLIKEARAPTPNASRIKQWGERFIAQLRTAT